MRVIITFLNLLTLILRFNTAWDAPSPALLKTATCQAAHSACCLPGPPDAFQQRRSPARIPSRVRDLAFVLIVFYEIPADRSSNVSRSRWLVALPVLASPASLLTAHFLALSRSLIKLWNRTDLWLDPCGNALVISLQTEYDPLSTKPSHPNRAFFFFNPPHCPPIQSVISLV